MIEIIAAVATGVIGAGVGFGVAKKINDANYSIFIEQAKAKAKAIEFEAQGVLKDANLKVSQAEMEARKKYEEKGSRLAREYEQKLANAKEIENNAKEALKNARASEEEVAKARSEAQSLYDEGKNLKAKYQEKMAEALATLERSAGLTEDEAKAIVLAKVEEKSRADIAHMVRKAEEEAKKDIKRRVNYILAQATSRFAGEFAAERLINVVNIKNDELKGRIIGKEGRNIKTLEMVLGVEFIID